MRILGKGRRGAIIAFSFLAVGATGWADEATTRPETASAENVLPPPENVEVIFSNPEDVPRVFHLDFVTRNVPSNQVIAVFIRRANGEYWPVPEERVSPRVIPINEKTSASVEVIGIPKGEPFTICLVALQKRGQELLREWLARPGEKLPLRSIAYGMELGAIHIP